jgi:hypothetical protein
MGLSYNITLNNLEELSALYEEMGTVFRTHGRNELSLTAHRVSFLIYPTNNILEKIVAMAKSLGILNTYVADLEEILKFHGRQCQGLSPCEEVLNHPL